MPRIIYFDIDCLRPDHLGCYGYDRPTSPAIDSIAGEGTRFNHYYCASSPCLPSRTALMSGRFGINNGVISNHGAGAQFHIDHHIYGGPRDHHQPFPRQLMKHDYDPICFSNFADRHLAMWYATGWREFHTINLKCGGETADEVNARVLPWLKKNAQREDYYLHINYWDTHRCYKMDAEWADRFKEFPVTQTWPDEKVIGAQQEVTGSFTTHGQFKDDKSPYPLMPGAVTDRASFEHMVTGYDASIAYVDAHVKEVLDELQAQGVLEDAVVIISSDHGDAFGEHAVYSDHVCIDECIQRIPLIIRWPGITPADRASDAFMYNVDFAPTVCDLLDIPIPEGWDGKSYAANVRGEAGEDRERLVWDSGLYTVQRAVRSREHLYIHTYDHADYSNRANDELYNMRTDPYQAENIGVENPELVEEYKQYMDDWVAEQQAKNGGLPDPVDLILTERELSL